MTFLYFSICYFLEVICFLPRSFKNEKCSHFPFLAGGIHEVGMPEVGMQEIGMQEVGMQEVGMHAGDRHAE